MIEAKIKIKCSKCSMVFREPVARIRNGFQMQYPHCLKLLTFDGSSDDYNIRRALKSAHDVRTAIEAARENRRQYRSFRHSPVTWVVKTSAAQHHSFCAERTQFS